MSEAHGLSVLLVEDEFMVALDAEQMVKELGAAAVEVVSTFEAAERRARDGQFDLVLLDVNLNGRLSYPLAEAIGRRGIPVILTTGYELRDQPDVPRGAVCLAKPYTVQRLKEALSQALHG
jgi:CheY-like chemotaxis protein